MQENINYQSKNARQKIRRIVPKVPPTFQRRPYKAIREKS
jgi:hypothetical protein